MKRTTMAVISGVFLTALIVVSAVFAQETKDIGSIQVRNVDEVRFIDLAKIPFNSAINSALTAVPGKVLKAELENENGFLVYGIEIAKADRQIADVKIDAGDGKILKIETDQKDNEGHEGEDSDNEEDDEK